MTRIDLEDIYLSDQATEALIYWCQLAAEAIILLRADTDDKPQIGAKYGVLDANGTLAIVCDVKLRDKTASIAMRIPDGHWRWREQTMN